MDSPLALSAAIFLAAVGVGLWGQYGLPRLSDSRNILFILSLILGVVSAASCLFHLLFLLIGPERAGRFGVVRAAYRAGRVVEAAE